MKIENHWLSDDGNVNFEFETPNTGGEFPAGRPDTLVIHFTGGSSAESSARHLCKPSSRASAHAVIGRDGLIYQLAPFNTITWHAGRSTWKDRSGLNHYAIGIELDNAGQLEPNGNGQYSAWFGRKFTQEDVFFGVHRNQSAPTAWHAYSETQIQRVLDLCALLIEYYGIRDILGHEEIAPLRKVDPGPAFPLDRLRARFFGETRDLDGEAEWGSARDRAIVDTERLNIRSGPGVSYPTVSEPILRGATVRTLENRNGWAEVECVTRGWVSSQYLKYPD